MIKGATFVLFSIAAVFVFTFFLFQWLAGYPFIYDPLCILLIFFCLAGHTLRKEVRDVFKAVDISLEAGRKQVGRIVGRDTSELSAQEIRTAGLETLAENLSDGVIAPLCWFLLLGVPGMLTYKLITARCPSPRGSSSPFRCWRTGATTRSPIASSACKATTARASCSRGKTLTTRRRRLKS